MKIENLKVEKKGNRARIAATIRWEDCDRPTREIYFETDEEFSSSLSCNPDTFLLACIIQAMHYGEERVSIDAEICPELRDGLITAMSLNRYWYGMSRNLVRIDAKTRTNTLSPSTPERAGFFFSGGIDSLATLRNNRLNFPLEHPWSFKDGLLVFGLEVDKMENFEHVISALIEIAHDADIKLIPVYTNIRCMDDGWWSYWENELEGAVFSAIAHAFTHRLTVVSIASSFDIPNLHPLGSHPLLDPCYSGSDMRIRHDGFALSRLNKTKLIADWDVAIQNIRVCNKSEFYQQGMLNCGKCEKCVRTMLAFLALGMSKKARAFPEHDISEELVQSSVILNKHIFYLYEELISPLKQRGRHDLACAIERKLVEHYRRQKINNLKTKIRRFDSKYLKCNLSRIKRLISF